MKNINTLKKFGMSMLGLAFTVIGLIVTSAVAATFSDGVIVVDQAKGMITALLCLVLSLIGSLALIHLILKRSFTAKSSKLVR